MIDEPQGISEYSPNSMDLTGDEKKAGVSALMPTVPKSPEERYANRERTLIHARSVSDMEDDAAYDESIANPPEVVEVLEPIAEKLRSDLMAAQSAKFDGIQEELLDALRQRSGHYSPSELELIENEGGTDTFDNVTDLNCNALEMWISEVVLFTTGQMPFDLKPTPMPDLPEPVIAMIRTAAAKKALMMVNAMTSGADEVDLGRLAYEIAAQLRGEIDEKMKADAADRAARMKNKIEDQFTEADMDAVFLDYLYDFATYKCAIMKGPIVRYNTKLKWIQQNGKSVAMPEAQLRYEYTTVSPFDFFPAPGIKNLKDGYCFERMRITPQDLSDLMEVPGYSESAIKQVLSKQPSQYLYTDPTDTERFQLEHKTDTSKVASDAFYTMWEYYNFLPGRLMNGYCEKHYNSDRSRPPQKYDDDKYYPVCCNMIGDIVVRCVINMDYILGDKPYHMASFRRKSHSIWGQGCPEVISDDQKTLNQAYRAAVNNTAICSLPQQEINQDRLAPGETIDSIYAGRILQTMNGATGGKAIEYYTPTFNAPEMFNIRDKIKTQISDKLGIPPFVYGNEKMSGAGSTSSGFQMLMQNAAKGVKKAILNIDKYTIKPLVHRQWLLNMLFDPDESIKGDTEIVAGGNLMVFAKESDAARRTAILDASMKHPVIGPMMAARGMLAAAREIFQSNGIEANDFLPNEKDLMVSMKLQEQQQLAAQAGAGAPPMNGVRQQANSLPAGNGGAPPAASAA